MNDSATTSASVVQEEEPDITRKSSEAVQSAMNGHRDAAAEVDKAEVPKEKKKSKSKIAVLWGKLDLDLPTAMMMMKAGIPPALSLAIYQSDAVSQEYTTLGYLIAVISILGFCIMPRAKFIQTMFFNVFGICLGAAVNLLALWSAIQARLNTTPQGIPQAYNSSQAAVLGIWLFFQIWLVNTFKAKNPQLAFPVIVYSIFVNVAAAYGAQFQTSAQAESFIKRLLYTMLTGCAIATGVSFVIFPVSCRKVVSKEFSGYTMALRGILQAHKGYLKSLETSDPFGTYSPPDVDGNSKPAPNAEVEALKMLTATLTQLHGKMRGDLPFAKREIAYGKLTPEDFENIFKLLRNIMMPIVGFGSLVDIFNRTAELHQWNRSESELSDPKSEALHQQAVDDWNTLMQSLHEPLSRIFRAMDGGLEHVLLRLDLLKPPKKKKGDQEAKGDTVQPGDPNFAIYLERESNEFYHGKEITLEAWLERKGVKLKGDTFQDTVDSQSTFEELSRQHTFIRQDNKRQLYVLLYIVFLLHSVSEAILELVKFADERNQAETKKKIILPGRKRLKKWVASAFKVQDSNHTDEPTLVGLERDSTVVQMGDAFKTKRDPEHLPPANAWENFGDMVRAFPRFLRSSESAFGFRVACATLSVAIIALLHDTQMFFIKQRLVWAMIMVAISMIPTTGNAMFTFLLRIIGTAVAMVVAWLCWYIPGQHTAGIIVFVWFFVSIGFYIPLKRPELIIVGLISVVTLTLIVGYELEVRKIGEALATSNGQPAYEIYLLGPYRLATVAGGLAVAFIWTYLPYPLSEHSALRQKLGGALYLSANYYSITHETVMARIRADGGDPTDPQTPGFSLTKARNKVFAKQMLLLQGLKGHSNFVKWEFPLGGKFPIEQYRDIVQLVTNIVNYTSLLSHASETFAQPSLEEDSDDSRLHWSTAFRKIVREANITSHEITSLLSMLSSSIQTGQPLPPYLKAPQRFELASRLECADRDILSIRHIAEPGYAAFAVLSISTTCINMDLEKLLKAVKKLVGEQDFSFHVVSTQSESQTSSSETLVKPSSRRQKRE